MRVYLNNSDETKAIMQVLINDPKYCGIFSDIGEGGQNLVVQTGSNLTGEDLRNALLAMIHDTVKVLADCNTGWTTDLANVVKCIVCETLCSDDFWKEAQKQVPPAQKLS